MVYRLQIVYKLNAMYYQKRKSNDNNRRRIFDEERKQAMVWLGLLHHLEFGKTTQLAIKVNNPQQYETTRSLDGE